MRARRLDELLYCDARLEAGAIQQDPAYLNILSCPDDVTVLEVAMHTRGLQVPFVPPQHCSVALSRLGVQVLVCIPSQEVCKEVGDHVRVCCLAWQQRYLSHPAWTLRDHQVWAKGPCRSCRTLRGCVWAAQAELAVLGSLCGFNGTKSDAAPKWRADGLRLLDSLYVQLAAAEARSAPLLQRLFQGAYQPFGEALEAWAFRAEGMPFASSSFATELPSDLRDLLPGECQEEVHVIHIHASSSHARLSFTSAWQTAQLLWQSDVDICI